MGIDVRHAVLDGPDGLDVREAPALREEALRLRHDNVFWCTTQAGGCGKRLRLHAGHQVIPYFQHVDRGAGCALQSGSRETVDAYFHISYQKALAAWLVDQGYTPRIEHTFPEHGGRADLHVTVEGVAHSIEVQLSRIPGGTWTVRTARYLAHVDRVTWLHGPTCDGTLAADRMGNGYALAVRTHANVVQIGVHWDEDHTDWSDITDCLMRPDGIWTPDLDAALLEVERIRAEREQAERRATAEAEQTRKEAEQRAAQLQQRQPERDADRRAADRWLRGQRAQAEAEPSDLVGSVPGPALRTFEQWEGLHPEMLGWAMSEDWSWLKGFNDVEQRAGKWMAYVAQRLYAKAMVDDMRHPELGEHQIDALLDALFAAGIATLEPGPHGRWARASYAS